MIRSVVRSCSSHSISLHCECLRLLMVLSVMFLACKDVDAFTIWNPTPTTSSMIVPTRLHMSSIPSNESPVVTNSITPTPGNIEANQGTNAFSKNGKSRWIDLPSSSIIRVMQQQRQQRMELSEQLIGRVAMAGAIGILIRECQDGQSIIEQVMNIM